MDKPNLERIDRELDDAAFRTKWRGENHRSLHFLKPEVKEDEISNRMRNEYEFLRRRIRDTFSDEFLNSIPLTTRSYD